MAATSSETRLTNREETKEFVSSVPKSSMISRSQSQISSEIPDAASALSENFGSLSYDYYAGEDLEKFTRAVQICQNFVKTFNKGYRNLFFSAKKLSALFDRDGGDLTVEILIFGDLSVYGFCIVFQTMSGGALFLPKELEYINKWTKEYGFLLDVIQEACDKTVMTTDNHRFAYADGILSKWYRAGVHIRGSVGIRFLYCVPDDVWRRAVSPRRSA